MSEKVVVVTDENGLAIKRKRLQEIDGYAAPTDEQTTNAINAWLDAHPEATTTVQDESLSYKKLIPGTLGFVTPEMYGAKGDGVTDDSAAFEDMIAATAVLSVNWICLGAKTYLLSRGISIERNLKITGQNNSRTIAQTTIKCTHSNNPAISIRNISGCVFEDFNVDGSNVCNTAIYVADYSYHHYFKNIQVQNATKGFSLGRAWNMTFDHCIADNCVDGYYSTGTITSSTWKDCVVYNSDNGWNITGACVYSSILSCGTDHTTRSLWLSSSSDIVIINFGAEDYESLCSVYGKAIFIGLFLYNRRQVQGSVYTITGPGTVHCYSCNFSDDDTFSIVNFYGVMNSGGVPEDNNITPQRIAELETIVGTSHGVTEETQTIATTTSNVQLSRSLSSSNCNAIILVIFNGTNIQSAMFPFNMFSAGYGCTIRWNDSNFGIVKRVDANHVSVTISGSYGIRIYSAWFGKNT